MKRIVVIGTGLAGLATAWHLLQHRPDTQVHLWDRIGIGAGASGIKSGLLHPYVGAHAKLNRFGLEGLHSATELIAVAQQYCGHSIIETRQLLRLALTPQQQLDYSLCAGLYDDVKQLTPKECQSLVPGITSHPGLLIKNALQINVPLYLNGLWLACQSHGAIFEQRELSNISELTCFDMAILTTGAGSSFFKELAHLKIEPVKGQSIELEWPESLPRLLMPISSRVSIAMRPNHSSCIIAGTFEHNVQDAGPTLETAAAYLLPRASALLPELKNAPILNCWAGFRASTSDHMPLISQINTHCWVFTGLGSRGLLYHSYFAEQLVKNIFA